MDDIEKIKNCWTIPSDWVIKIAGDKMQVLDSENEQVVTAMTQINIIEQINQHIEAQESWAAYKLMEAVIKEPIEA